MYIIEVYNRGELEYTQGYFPTEEIAKNFAEQYEVDAKPGMYYRISKH